MTGRLLRGLDVSNYSDDDIRPLLAAEQPEHVVVRLSTESGEHTRIARAQIDQALAFGASVSGYIWAYFDLDPVQHTAHALAVASGYPVDLAWFDCEGDAAPNLDDWLSRAVALAESRRWRCGIYTSFGWWRENGDSQGFKRLPLWLANYNGLPSLTWPDLDLPGGWSQLAGHQYHADPDRSVFDAVVIQPDPCAALKAALRAELARPRLSRRRLRALVE